MKSIIFAVSLTFALGLPWGCKPTDNRRAKPPRPSAQCAMPTFDFGEIGFSAAKITHVFRILNAGDAELHVKNIRSDCPACVVADISRRELKPGDDAEIEAVLELGGANPFNSAFDIEKKLYVETDDSDHAVIELTIRGKRGRRHFYYPPEIAFKEIQLGKAETKIIYYLPDGEKINRTPAVHSTTDAIAVEIKERLFETIPFQPPNAASAADFPFALDPSVYPRKGYEISASLSPAAPAGEFFQYVVIDTGDDFDPEIMVPVSASIKEPLAITPRRVFFGMIFNNDIAVKQTVTIKNPTGQPFTIKHVKSEIAFIIPSIAFVSPSETRIDLLIDRSQMPPGNFRGLLTVTSDYPTMEQFTIGTYGRASAISQ